MSKVTYQTLRRNSNPVFQYLGDSWDSGDLWGSAMSAGFAVCTVLDAMGRDDLIPVEMGYSRGATARPTLDNLLGVAEDEGDWETTAYAEAVRAGEITPAHLALAARVLHRYIDALREAGRDY